MNKILSVLLSISLMFTFLMPVSASTSKSIENLVANRPYKVSTPPRDVWEDTDNKELTDGQYGTVNFKDEKWQGHHKADQVDQKRSIVFDLGSPKTIKRIKSNYLHRPDAGIHLPKTVSYFVSSDGDNWEKVVDLQTKTHLASDYTSIEPVYWDAETEGSLLGEAKGIYAQYVKVEFEIDSPWVFIDEVEVLGHDGFGQGSLNVFDLDFQMEVESSSMPSFKKDTSEFENYAVESKIASDSSISKDELEKLVRFKNVDGSSEKSWVKFTDNAPVEIMLDLEDIREIVNINFNTIHKEGFSHPEKVEIMVSEDNDSWYPLYTLKSKYPFEIPNNSIQHFVWDGRVNKFLGSDNGESKAKAAKVKLIIHAQDSFAIEKIQVLGSDKLLGDAVSVAPEKDPELEVPAGADFVRSKEELKHINDIGLIYNHVDHQWKAEHLIPYIAYIDEEGQIQDRFFDTLLYLGLRTPGGPDTTKTFDTNTQNPAGKEEWEWYLERTFKENGDLDALNEASRIVAEELNDGYKQKFFIMIPYPSTHLDEFGELNGEVLSFNPNKVSKEKSYENRIKAINWYIDEVMKGLDQKDYQYLDFAGFYWVAENIESGIPYEEKLVVETSHKVHQEDALFFWIPYFRAAGFRNWEEYGFDFAIMQPNFYFDKYSKESRLEETSLLARRYGMGVEIEFDERMLINASDSDEKIQKFKEYLEFGEKYQFNNDVIRAYYQGGKTMYTMAHSEIEKYRELYDLLFDFINHDGRVFENTLDLDDSDLEEPTIPEGPEIEEPTIPEGPEIEEPTIPEGPEIDEPTIPEGPKVDDTTVPKVERPINSEVEKTPGLEDKLPFTGRGNLALISSGIILLGYAIYKKEEE